MENYGEILVVLAKSMKGREILHNLEKALKVLNHNIATGKYPDTYDGMKNSREFNEAMTHSQLFITKMAYEGKDMMEALKDVSEYRKEFQLKKEVENIKKGNSN